MNKIAVVGMAGIFPGALTTEKFLRNIIKKREAIVEIPDGRWIADPGKIVSEKYIPDTAASSRAGIVSGFEFDPAGFNIPADILGQLDILHKMVLHAGREALSQCSSTAQLRKRTGAVLAAIALPTEKTSEIAWQVIMNGRRGDDLKSIDALAAGMVSAPASILAGALGLMGGSFTLDAACASSLYSIKIACDLLNSKKSDMMLAGGVSRPDSLYTQIGFTQLKALSKSGRCSPFDRSADGLVVGEGAGVVVLKRLEDAIHAGDRILGVIAGAGWSNDIEGNLVAPASEGQIRAMRAAYRSAGWSPSDVDYIECHGSATPIGDNIELGSMSSLWREAGLGNRGCAIGSIKSMTGHLLTAAGAAGFIKTILAINEKVLPPSLNFREPAPNSPLLTTDFHVQTEPEEWKVKPSKNSSSYTDAGHNGGGVRRAGVSAFGFGGINGHILVEEFIENDKRHFFAGSSLQPDPESESESEPKSESNQKSDKCEVSSDKSRQSINPNIETAGNTDNIAIVGMEIVTPLAENLDIFRKSLFRTAISVKEIEKNQDNGLPYSSRESLQHDPKKTDGVSSYINEESGIWFKNICTYPGEFHIPPNQIEDLLPQHLIMLKAARGALSDAGISLRPGKGEPSRENFGAAIGIDFDYGATDFHLRWRQRIENEGALNTVPSSDTVNSFTSYAAPGQLTGKMDWHDKRGSKNISPGNQVSEQSEKMRYISPPLTSERTLGALGGIVASRVAREFRFGGPCFTISAGAASGIEAIEIGIGVLQRGECDTFLCGSVDMAGDIREDSLFRTLKKYAESSERSIPFDERSKGAFPSEGAAAVVIKTLQKAKEDNDRIYAVIKGVGASSGNWSIYSHAGQDSTPENSHSEKCGCCNNRLSEPGSRNEPEREITVRKMYQKSLTDALEDSGLSFSDIGLYQAHASGDPNLDFLEAEAVTGFAALNRRVQDSEENRPASSSKNFSNAHTCAVGSSASILGDTGSLSSMLSVIQSALALYHTIVPPVAGFISPPEKLSSPFSDGSRKNGRMSEGKSGKKDLTGQSCDRKEESASETLKCNSWEESGFYFPISPAYWIKENFRKRRSACIASITSDGACSHIVLQEFSADSSCPEHEKNNQERMAQERIAQKRINRERVNPTDAYFSQLEKWKRESKQKNLSGIEGKIAFLYPGSGNHFPGMGRALSALFPEILRELDKKGASLNSRMLPDLYYPRRVSWKKGWQDEVSKEINSHAHNMIFGQVSFGYFMTRIAEKFNLKPDACVGHSLGETAGLFSLGVWRDPEEMLHRMESSDLFTVKLAGECTAAASAWKLPEGVRPDWKVAAVNRSPEFIESIIKSGRNGSLSANNETNEISAEPAEYDRLYLLIVNTPEECVIGGSSEQVEKFINETGCGAMYLDGVVTVHCPVAKICEDEYLDLHRFECTPPEGVDFYSCFRGARYTPQTEDTARSITDQALYGFDYTRLINRAWEDGVRIFIEMGPGNSCTRAVSKILGKRPHLAVSLSSRDESEEVALFKALRTLAENGVELEIDGSLPGLTDSTAGSYSSDSIVSGSIPSGSILSDPISSGSIISGSAPDASSNSASTSVSPVQTSHISVKAPGHANTIALAAHRLNSYRMVENTTQIVSAANLQEELDIIQESIDDQTENCNVSEPEEEIIDTENTINMEKPIDVTAPQHKADQNNISEAVNMSDLADPGVTARITADAHMKFLEFSEMNMAEMERQFSALTKIASTLVNRSSDPSFKEVSSVFSTESDSGRKNAPLVAPIFNPIFDPIFDRDQCMEFAVGSAAAVLGEKFSIVDQSPVRVRLPDEPLMLVDRIVSIEGEMLSLKSGKIITQHDVKPGAWYLDGGKAPVSISIEAGQADLFLCSWLGIDHAVMGKRRYRLLDAKVTFHRTLPTPGETIEYHIEIDRFLKQGEIYLFFFHYRGFIGNDLLISMRDGCAGFFTPEEVENSGGIILKKEDTEHLLPENNVRKIDAVPFSKLLPLSNESYSEDQVESLRLGDLESCFGRLFRGISLGKNMRLPGIEYSHTVSDAGSGYYEPIGSGQKSFSNMDMDGSTGKFDGSTGESCAKRGKMHLIDRVLAFDPEGGRFGMGFISAEADIHPDDWFLICHFVDDMVMPGTLMYECCAHALRIFTQRMGWVTDRDEPYYDIIPGIESDLKCRGPVTTRTSKARYEIEIKEMGYLPEPYVIADAHMFSDNHRIVLYRDMGMKIAGLSRDEIERFWKTDRG